MSVRDAEEKARQLIGNVGTCELPIPVERIAAEHGAQLAYVTLEPDVSGLLFREEGRVVIGVNSRHPPVRQRFTIAHEIGHLMMHDGRPMFIDRLVRVNARDGSIGGEELDANSFAAELLMPRDRVDIELAPLLAAGGQIDPGSLAEQLAVRFGVSAQAMGYRLTNLGVLDPGSGS